MNVHFLKSKEKKKIVEELTEIYGITELPYLLLETGKQKIRGYSGHLSREELSQLGNILNVELIGMYLISKKDDDPRLNFDAVPLFRKKITKSIVEINKEQLALWVRGHDIDIACPRGIAVIKYQDDLIGIGKSNTEKIFNYVPKERKIKTQLPKKEP